MVDDDLLKRIPAPDVALSQHLLPGIAGTVGTLSGPFMSAEDGIKVTEDDTTTQDEKVAA